jgi:DNA replication and repair protein RecF
MVLHYLHSLSLTTFRNYRDLDIALPAAPIVLTGANGAGKTNILEAVSLLIPGRGLRRADLADFQQFKTNEIPWAIHAEVMVGDDNHAVGTGLSPGAEGDDTETDKRIIRINGKTMKSQQALADLMAIVWLTPEMDRTLDEGASARRHFWDRLVAGFDPAHHGRLHRYEKAMRARMRLLQEGGSGRAQDSSWLAALEDDMAKSGIAIAAARLHFNQDLIPVMNESQSGFPAADCHIRGFAEEALGSQPALQVEDRFRDLLASNRERDAARGQTEYGIHKSDLDVWHRQKQCPATYCSTGEQKALLIAIMLAYARLSAARRGMTPILLLDDIISHLDEDRRQCLYNEILALRAQAWVTGTDSDLFAGLRGKAQFFSVQNHGLAGENLSQKFYGTQALTGTQG